MYEISTWTSFALLVGKYNDKKYQQVPRLPTRVIKKIHAIRRYLLTYFVKLVLFLLLAKSELHLIMHISAYLIPDEKISIAKK